MDSKSTETKTPLPSRSKISEISKSFQNLNPNLSGRSPGLKKISNSQGEMEQLSRDRLLEDARNSGPLSGSGRVPHLVEAFERLFKDEYGSKENNNQSCVKNQAFGGRDLLLTAENQVSSSWDNSLPCLIAFRKSQTFQRLYPALAFQAALLAEAKGAQEKK